MIDDARSTHCHDMLQHQWIFFDEFLEVKQHKLHSQPQWIWRILRQFCYSQGNAALNNFFRAWSRPKKQWCCSNRGKGCEGNSPPSVDPGAGMVWKHVQVNGFWTWVVAGAAGGGGAMPPSLPYACNVGVVNWKIGWSSPKKAWCCKHNNVCCPGQAGGDGGASSHVTVHYSHGGTAAGGAAGGAAGASGSWSSSWHSSGGHVTEVHHEYHTVHHDRRLGGWGRFGGSWSESTTRMSCYCPRPSFGIQVHQILWDVGGHGSFFATEGHRRKYLITFFEL